MSAIVVSDSEAIERALIEGDLSQLTSQQRVTHYMRTCEDMKLNPRTKPFEYIRLNGKLVLYARRDCTDQLRKVHRVSLTIVSREKLDDLYVVTARATMPDGRTDEATGAVSLAKLAGEALANQMMKAETKAKRRVTLSIVGLGMLDETEVVTIPGAHVVPVDEPHQAPQLAKASPTVAVDELVASISASETIDALMAHIPRIKEAGLSKDRKVREAYDIRSKALKGAA